MPSPHRFRLLWAERSAYRPIFGFTSRVQGWTPSFIDFSALKPHMRSVATALQRSSLIEARDSPAEQAGRPLSSIATSPDSPDHAGRPVEPLPRVSVC